MASEWPLVRLGEVLKVQHGWPFKSESFCEDEALPLVVAIGNFRYTGGFRFDETQRKYYSGSYPHDYELRPGEILLVMTCQTAGGEILGIPARIPADGRIYLHNQRMGRIAKIDARVDDGFLYYLFLSADFNRHLVSTASGTKILHTSPGRIEDFQLRLPQPSTQREIGKILGALDAKIDLLQEQSKSLEAIARAIFKSWFVNFDPVRAKAEGREPEGMDAATAALFPDTFEVSEGGSLPKGWRLTTLGTEVELSAGRIQTGPFGSQLHASDYVTEGVPVVMPQDISNRRVSTTRVARINESNAVRLSRHRLEAGDIICSRRGDVERHAQIGKRETGWLCGTGCLLVRIGSKWPFTAFVSLALDRPEARNWINQHAIGATLPNLNTGILSAVPLTVPPDGILRAFTEIADPIDQLISANNAQSITLATIRDTLLPRLISGKLRVPEAEKLVEAII